jgi:hypothetical protein
VSNTRFVVDNQNAFALAQRGCKRLVLPFLQGPLQLMDGQVGFLWLSFSMRRRRQDCDPSNFQQGSLLAGGAAGFRHQEQAVAAPPVEREV